MERGCSLLLFQFQPVCVRCKTWQATRTAHSATDFCGGAVQPESRAEVSLRGQRLLLTRKKLHMQIDLKASLTDDGASRPSGTVGTDLEVVILPSWLHEDY